MNGTRALTALSILLALVGCHEVPVELDPLYTSRAQLCAGMDCSAAPRCDDGGNACLACSCCACTDGETSCDPDRFNVLWRCQGGCFVDEPCSGDLQCHTEDGVSACSAGTIDCGSVNPYDLIAVCGVTDSLCAQCGPCLDCSQFGQAQVCDSMRPSGSPDSVLSCVSGNGCFEPQPCPTGAHCVMGLMSGLVSCSDTLDCATLGCTGFPICDQPGVGCGDCGCCDVSLNTPPDTCGLVDGTTTNARYIFDTTRRCYTITPCADNEICVFDSHSRPLCTAY